jgi:hypothetical protein
VEWLPRRAHQLGRREDDALLDVAAFQLAAGFGGLLHGHGFVRAQARAPPLFHQRRIAALADGADLD